MNYITIIFICLSCVVLRPAEAKEKPLNIVYILADDMSWGDLSCYGQQQFTTPHIDRLAESGVVFTQAYAGAPECAPSRGTLLTGMHAGHAPIRDNSSVRGQEYIPDSVITVAEVLKQAGYTTAFVGKWGVGLPGTEGVPEKQGFDYSFGFYDQGRAHTFYPRYLMENGHKINYPANYQFDMRRRYVMNGSLKDSLLNRYDEDGKIILSELDEPDKAVYAQLEVDKAAFKFLEGTQNQPFFLYYATQLPHGPLIIDDLADMKDNAVLPQRQREWAAMVKRLDTFVGDLVAYLKSTDEYEHTLILFSSDNGYAMCGYMGRGNRNKNWPDDPYLKNKGPFVGGKFSALEGGARVPFMMACPALFSPKKIDVPVWLIDFYATVSDLVGVHPDQHCDGNSLMPLVLRGDASAFENRPMYFFKQQEQSVRYGPWKAYRKTMKSKTQLYDIEKDGFCENDLADHHPDVIALVDSVMDHAHTPHPWYRDPWESGQDVKVKRNRAKAEGSMQSGVRPNGL